jgi:hypothetical protein
MSSEAMNAEKKRQQPSSGMSRLSALLTDRDSRRNVY